VAEDDRPQHEAEDDAEPLTRVTTSRKIRWGVDWRRWLPPGVAEPRSITRAELLADLKRNGLSVSERELRYWESLGALPNPVRQPREGAAHAAYPWWHGEIVAKVPQWRGQGLSWEAIGEQARVTFADRANHTGPIGRWENDEKPPLTPDVVAALQRFIAHVNREHGLDIQVALLHLGGAGGGIDYTLFPQADPLGE
jgi:hypothetical protein